MRKEAVEEPTETDGTKKFQRAKELSVGDRDGRPEDMGKRNRGERGRESQEARKIVLKRVNRGVLQERPRALEEKTSPSLSGPLPRSQEALLHSSFHHDSSPPWGGQSRTAKRWR